MHRTDTIALPRIVATAAHPLTPTRRRPRWLAVVVLALFALALVGTITAARAIAWAEPAPDAGPAYVTDIAPDALADLADLASQHSGTDAGIVTP